MSGERTSFLKYKTGEKKCKYTEELKNKIKELFQVEYPSVIETFDQKSNLSPILIEKKKLFLGSYDHVFYERQLQLLFEDQYFHWVTVRALNDLVNEDFLETVNAGDQSKPYKFYCLKSARSKQRKINKILSIAQKFSSPEITSTCGAYAEHLFYKAFVQNGFKIEGISTRSFNDKSTRNGVDLDIIVSKDGKNYGCEIKNKLAYVDKEVVNKKIKLANHLKLIPVFVFRNSSKHHIHKLINEKKGFVLIFKTQIYPPCLRDLVDDILTYLSLPVICSEKIPKSIIDRFLVWHSTQIEN